LTRSTNHAVEKTPMLRCTLAMHSPSMYQRNNAAYISPGAEKFFTRFPFTFVKITDCNYFLTS